MGMVMKHIVIDMSKISHRFHDYNLANKFWSERLFWLILGGYTIRLDFSQCSFIGCSFLKQLVDNLKNAGLTKEQTIVTFNFHRMTDACLVLLYWDE